MVCRQISAQRFSKISIFCMTVSWPFGNWNNSFSWRSSGHAGLKSPTAKISMAQFDFDYVVVGSGFGGSVSALRLSEKGYKVAVLERGKRWTSSDFPQTNWNVRKYLWSPKLFCFGIQAITLLRDVLILHGSGVGLGAALVYANTLLIPPDSVFEDPHWRSLGNWQADLAPHYAEAKRMLGVTTAECQTETDHMLRQIAGDMGREATFHPTQVGVFFGEQGKAVPDPYFGGAGPERAGCVQCGGCMVGCRHNAKNTLDKNYLYFAEKNGATIIPGTDVRAIRELASGGYKIDTVRITDVFFKRRRTFRHARDRNGCRRSWELPHFFLHCKSKGWLPKISDRIGTYVRTNSEALVGSRTRNKQANFSKGIAIASGFKPDEHTHVEMVRYGEGQDFMSLLSTFLVGGGPPWPRPLRFLAAVLRHPVQFLRFANPMGWAKSTGVLLVMQSLPNHMSLALKRVGTLAVRQKGQQRLGFVAASPQVLPSRQRISGKAGQENGWPRFEQLSRGGFEPDFNGAHSGRLSDGPRRQRGSYRFSGPAIRLRSLLCGGRFDHSG